MHEDDSHLLVGGIWPDERTDDQLQELGAVASQDVDDDIPFDGPYLPWQAGKPYPGCHCDSCAKIRGAESENDPF